LPEDDDNKTPYLSEVFDDHITKTIPFYYLFHQETIKFIRSFPSLPNIWLDTGCGTGTLVNMALGEFPKTNFFLLDPSESMLTQARQKLINTQDGRIKFLKPSPTQNFSQELEKNRMSSLQYYATTIFPGKIEKKPPMSVMNY